MHTELGQRRSKHTGLWQPQGDRVASVLPESANGRRLGSPTLPSEADEDRGNPKTRAGTTVRLPVTARWHAACFLSLEETKTRT